MQNEDCGQMSAWYIFSAMGFYPVNPVSGEYIVGSPFFEFIRLKLPDPSSSLSSSSTTKTISLTIKAPGARTKPYVKSLTINGVKLTEPVIKHEQLMAAGGEVEVDFEMSETVEEWGNDRDVLAALGVFGTGEWARDEL
jgi:putative alpha-1,2-mannosidase